MVMDINKVHEISKQEIKNASYIKYHIISNNNSNSSPLFVMHQKGYETNMKIREIPNKNTCILI